MANRLSFHFFTSFGGPPGSLGLWRHPELVPPQPVLDIDGWIELVRLAERARIDSVFFADAVGMGGHRPGDLEPEVRAGRTLLFDPAVLVSVLGRETEHIGLMFTSSILQAHPFPFARTMSTLDHMTGGRVGWNIVTSYSPNAARNLGMDDLPPREERYRWAQEYVDVCYRLWEGSWEDDAVIADPVSGAYVDSSRVHQIDYVGERYKVKGPHLVHPSPQRTPVLVQAGGSPTGQAFAARHAEVQFIGAAQIDAMARNIAEVLTTAETAGRPPGSVHFVTSGDFFVGSTEEEARRLSQEFDDKVDAEDLAAKVSESSGIDLTGVALDTPTTKLDSLNSKGIQGYINALRSHLPADRDPTVREVLVAGLHYGRVVGTPEQIADELERWRDVGVGGVVLWERLRPRSLTTFVEQVAPVLKDRGLMQREYAPGTLREKLLGGGPRLPDTHPAAGYRKFDAAG